jgi:hypothetical protein
MPTWDQIVAFVSAPGVGAIILVGIGAAAWFTLGKRTRVAAISSLGGVFTLALEPANALLSNLGSSILVGLAQAALLFADLTLFVAPIVLALDRVIRNPLRGISGWRPWVAYVAAIVSGLVACWAGLIALWWITEIEPELLGSVEVAVFGGVVAACLALVRADRQIEVGASQSLP